MGRTPHAGSYLRWWSWRRKEIARLTWVVLLDETCPSVAVFLAKVDIQTYLRVSVQGPAGITG